MLAVVVTSRMMPRKTRKGRIAWEKIAGLEEYIRRAEVDDIREQERQGVFERLLPYAIVFGLSKRWGKAFEDLYRQPPDWYRPARPGFLDLDAGQRHRPLDLDDEPDLPLPAAVEAVPAAAGAAATAGRAAASAAAAVAAAASAAAGDSW